MNALRKVHRWPAWKHWIFITCVFVLGLLIGRLLIDRWQLVAAIAAVVLCMALLVLPGKKK